MAVTDIPSIYYPSLDSQLPSIAGSSGLTASGHKVGAVFHAPKTGTIDRVLFRTSTVSGSGSVDVRLETVSSGKPSGTLWSASTNATQAVTGSNVAYEVTLGAGASVAQGDLIAIVIAWVSGTSTQVTLASTSSVQLAQFPGLYLDTGSGYSIIASRSSLFAMRYSDAVYRNYAGGLWVNTSGTSSTFSSGEKGIRFYLPIPMRVSGLWHNFDPDTALTFNLYADAIAPGGTKLLTKTQQASEFESSSAQLSFLQFDSTATLASGWYRATCEVSAASTRYPYIQAATNARLGATPAGKDFYLTESSGASWVDTDTIFPSMGLIVDGVDLGSGGGAAGRRNMRGGFIN